MLLPNNALNFGRSISSDNGQYTLVQQTDGNLAYYRNPGIVRFATYRAGNISIMQGDGNFVQYAGNVAVWNTQTGGNPGAILAVQDDGNLVVYGRNYVPLWNIGADANPNDPKKVGDVVGRDLIGNPLGPIGHLGIWDGNSVVQAGPNTTANTIHYESLSTFKTASSHYWGTASPNIPDNIQLSGCWSTFCLDTPFQGVDLRYVQYSSLRNAVVKRAYQAYLIGADYSIVVGSLLEVEPANQYTPAQRGRYRCDTFVITTLRAGSYFSTSTTRIDGNYWSQDYNNWKSRVATLLQGIVLPYSVFDKLKTNKF